MQKPIRALILAAMPALASCATTVGGIQKEPVIKTYLSAKAPLDIAKCMQAQAPGLDIEFVGEVISVSNRNGYGNILINWLIKPASGGSSIDVRRTSRITAGIAHAEICF